MSELIYDVQDAGDSTCIAFVKGAADLATQDEFEKAMRLVEAHPAKFVVVDVRNLTFITSLAVGELVKVYQSKKAAGGRVVIAGANQYVQGVFKAARLTSVMPIVETVEAGVAACAGCA